jgi:hypothetical protein
MVRDHHMGGVRVDLLAPLDPDAPHRGEPGVERRPEAREAVEAPGASSNSTVAAQISTAIGNSRIELTTRKAQKTVEPRRRSTIRSLYHSARSAEQTERIPTMSFEVPEHIRPLRARVRQFIEERIYPIETARGARRRGARAAAPPDG